MALGKRKEKRKGGRGAHCQSQGMAELSKEPLETEIILILKILFLNIRADVCTCFSHAL